MDRERWHKIDELLEAALDLSVESRREFLERHCQGDTSTKREVERLLAAHDHAAEFIESPPLDDIRALLGVDQNDPLIGRSLVHYKVLSRIGAGGMGTVYLAQDARLGRNVALKVLSRRSTQDDDQVRRFQHEAFAASALNHPNILTIYEVGQDSDLHFIATEFVEGETLRELLRGGPLPVLEALELANQVAGALAAAHAAGIVHRDVKPENIMLRPDGLVKVLDFGLAKLTQRTAVGGAGGTAPASFQTASGIVMGTVSYMSPEQARGRAVDSRSDVFSLAVMLYEMVAGVRPFDGESVTDVLVAILEREARPLRSVLPEAPLELERILNRALSKDREIRHADAAELQTDLSNLKRMLDGSTVQDRASCPSCRQIITAGLAFCSSCGSSLSRPCPNCGKQVFADDSFCGLCGYDLRNTRQTVVETRFVNPIAQSTQTISSEPERRPATVVYSTVSGCSAIFEQLDPEEANRLLGAIKQSLSDVITSHGGIVYRCSSDELVAVFGVPSAYEDDSLRAARAALALRDRIAVWSREVDQKVGRQLHMFAGLNSGAVVARIDGEAKHVVTGDPFQIASRLAAHAAANEILVNLDTERSIAPYFRFEQRTPLALGPQTSSTQIFQIVGESGVQTRIEAAEAVGLTRFIGRDKELNVLISSLEKASGGAGQFLTVLGEPGSGKSRLLLEFYQSLKNLPVTILVGRCQSHKRSTAYFPFIDVLMDLLRLREACSESTTDAAVSGIRSIDPGLEPYIPLYLHLLSLQSAEHPLDADIKGDELRLSILDALSAIITVSTTRGTAVVLLEDWHWADEGSIEVLKKLAGLVSTHPLMIVVSSRRERAVEIDFPETHAAIHLAPLDETATAGILQSICNASQLPEGLADLLYKKTGGNPFFIEEVCRTLIETRRLRVADGVAILEGSLEDLNIPETVQAVIRTRLDRLSAESQRLLRYASVQGREFSLPVLERIIGDRTQIPRKLETMQKQGLIQQVRVLPDPVYRFKHVLTQEVAYDSLLLHQKKSLHRAVGKSIEAVYAGRLEEQLELLAHHYSQAEEWGSAAKFGMESAEKATGLSRFSEAIRMLEETEEWLLKLDESDERRERLALALLKQERLCETLGFRRRQQELVDRLLSMLDPDREPALAAAAYVRQGELYTLLNRFDEAEHVLKQALTMHRSISDWAGERTALRAIGFLYWRWGRYDDAIEINRTAVAMDLAQGDRAAYAHDLTSVGSALRSQGKFREALQCLEEALEIHETLSRPASYVYALDVTANVYREQGDNEKALEYYRRAVDQALQYRLLLHRLMPLSSIATVLWELGQTEESLSCISEVIEQSRSLNLERELVQSLTTLSQRLLALDRADEALPHLAEATEIYARLGERDEEARALTSLAYVQEQCGSEPGEILATWERVRSLRRDRFDAKGQLEALEGMSRAARNQFKNPPLALEYLRQAHQVASQLNDQSKQGDLLNTMGILEWERGNYLSALEHYQKALGLFRQTGDSVHAGLMLNSIGVTMAKLGRKDEAISGLNEAVAVHRQTGQRLLEGHALSALGDLFVETESLDAAIQCYEESLAIRREIDDRKGEGWMLRGLARVYFLREEKEHGGEFLKEATNIARETSDHRLMDECMRLAKYCE